LSSRPKRSEEPGSRAKQAAFPRSRIGLFRPSGMT
jgi:hypothetical protein